MGRCWWTCLCTALLLAVSSGQQVPLNLPWWRPGQNAFSPPRRPGPGFVTSFESQRPDASGFETMSGPQDAPDNPCFNGGPKFRQQPAVPNVNPEIRPWWLGGPNLSQQQAPPRNPTSLVPMRPRQTSTLGPNSTIGTQDRVDRLWWLGGPPMSQQQMMIPSSAPDVLTEAPETALLDARADDPKTSTSAGFSPVKGFSADIPSTNVEDISDGCLCVEYYLCDTNNTILTDGASIVDPRFGEVLPEGSTCPGLQVCCKPPVFVPSEPGRPVPMDPGVLPLTPPTKIDGRVAGTTPDTCGTPFPQQPPLESSFARILVPDGGDTLPGEFPWMLAVLRYDEGVDEDPALQCGASLVHPRVALTAAHCVEGVEMTSLRVRAGEWDTQSATEPFPHQELGVSAVLIHPEFRAPTLYNDMALLVLEREYSPADNVGVVCLADQAQTFVGERCVATGWGRDSFGPRGKPQITLRRVDMPVLDSDDCQAKLRTTRLGPFYRLHKSFLCAGGEEGRDTCKGDGGGPLVCPLPGAPARYIQAGIVSWGIGCGDDGVPAVYASVSELYDWLNTQLQLLD